MVTLKDIAGKAKVSQATVSRVLNNDPALSITPEKRELIIDIAKELNYKTVTQRVQEQQSGVIGVTEQPAFFSMGVDITKKRIGIAQMFELSEQAQDIYYISLKQMVDQACFSYGWTTVLFSRNEEGRFIKHDNDPVDGIICIGRFTSEEIADFEKHTPNIVFLDSNPDAMKYYSIMPNYHMAVRQVLAHSFALGKKRIAYAGSVHTFGDKKELSTDARYYYYQNKMLSEGLFDEELIIDCPMNAAGGYEAMNQYLESHKDVPEVIFAASDAVVPGIVKSLYEHHLTIPGDVGVVTFNNTSFSEFSSPPLSSIEVHLDEGAKMAAQCLIFGWMHNAGLAKKIVIPCKLIDRGSVK
ncbi:MAG: LacI family DNA-binding transcriptional regulator [Eubacterium sp.]|nr:LacI family DNA-binding transcriptional regulator [Candidatus Colimonas fimequi]